jgi:hypothetical protein
VCSEAWRMASDCRSGPDFAGLVPGPLREPNVREVVMTVPAVGEPHPSSRFGPRPSTGNSRPNERRSARSFVASSLRFPSPLPC